ncbi:MAG: hypothetical protein AB8B51_08075 [Sedimentitalea sp.]
MAQGYSLKDQLFNTKKVGYLAGLFEGIDQPAFEGAVMARLLDLELKERITWIAQCLGEALPGNLPQIAPALLTALPPPLDPGKQDDDFGDFIFAPLGELVAARGLDHPELALNLLGEITQRFSMEWAIRPFLNHCPELVLARLAEWVHHDSYHVRRLVSEGTRPRLPWGMGVALDLSDPLALLDQLHRDSTRYVTRSVANHLNDITKKDPDLVMDRLEHWAVLDQQSPNELAWMRSHSLRGLVKAGHPRALAMLGYRADADLACDVTIKPAPVHIDGALDFKCRISAPESTPVLVDYVIHFAGDNGHVRRKVFKLKQGVVTGKAPLEMTKVHKLKGNASTFRLVPGAHQLDVQVNGTIRATAAFTLLKPA